MIPCTTGIKAESPKTANEAERVARKAEVRNRGIMVNIPQPKAMIVALSRVRWRRSRLLVHTVLQ